MDTRMNQKDSKLKTIFLENWIPSAIGPMLALIGAVSVVPLVQDWYNEKDNLNRERLTIFKAFGEDFSKMRDSVDWLVADCANSSHTSEPEAKMSKEIWAEYDKLLSDSQNLIYFFGSDALSAASAFSAWFGNLKFSCQTVDTAWPSALKGWQQKIQAPMQKKLFGS